MLKLSWVGIRQTIKLISLTIILSSIPINFSLATPLSSQKCTELRKLRTELIKSPSVKQMAKGFEWVKANLEGEDLLPIQNFIETEEQLRFRCKKKGKMAALKNKKPKQKKIKEKQKVKKTPPLPERKLLMSYAEPKAKPVKIIPIRKPAAKKQKKSNLKPIEEPSILDYFFPDDEEPDKKAKKAVKKSAKKQ